MNEVLTYLGTVHWGVWAFVALVIFIVAVNLVVNRKVENETNTASQCPSTLSDAADEKARVSWNKLYGSLSNPQRLLVQTLYGCTWTAPNGIHHTTLKAMFSKGLIRQNMSDEIGLTTECREMIQMAGGI